MAKLKLKIVLVPIQFSDVPSSSLDSSQSRRFLHLADADSDLGKVCDELTKRYGKLYPDDDKLAIMSLQDDDRCDLDPDFEAGDVFNSGDIVRVIVENELQNLSNHTSFNQSSMMAADNTPAVMRLVDLNKQTQSTPIFPPAPMLTQDSSFPASSRKRSKEYFDSTDMNIPSKQARRTVWSSRNEMFIEPKVPAIPLTPQLNVTKKRQNNSSPPKTQNSDIEDINETNISLPPPDIGEDRSIPQKKSSSTKPKEEALPGKKRITSGMLSMPAHTQLEKEDVHHESKLSRRSKHYLYSRALYSDMGGSEATSSDLDSDESSLDFKDKSREVGIENISKEDEVERSNDEVEDRPLASLYEETIKNTPNIQEETLTKTEIMNLFKNGMKIPARLQNKSQNESARSRNLSALMKNLEIDMVDKNPVLSSEEKRATRAAANRKTRTALKKAQTSKVANTKSKDSNIVTSVSDSKKGSQSKSSHPKRSKSSERESSDPKISDSKNSEPENFKPRISESKSSEPKSPKSKSSNAKGPDPKGFDGKISDPKDSDPRHAIQYISNPSELLSSLKSITAFNKESSNKNTNGVSCSQNKTVRGPNDTHTKESAKSDKKADSNDNKNVQQFDSKYEVVDQVHVKEATPSININSSNDKLSNEEMETNGPEIKPLCPPEGFQPSFTDLAGTSKLGALFEKMKQFDEKLNVLNKKGRYNAKQVSQRDGDSIESSSSRKERIAEPQINTTKSISSAKNDINKNINEVHSTPTKQEQSKSSIRVVKPESSTESKSIQSEHNDVLPATTQDQQMGNLGIYANLNSYPISYNNMGSNSHSANNTSNRNNSSPLNTLSRDADTKSNPNNVNSSMGKGNNKDIPNIVNNLMSKENDNNTSVTDNLTSRSNDKVITSTVHNDKNTSVIVNNSTIKNNANDIPSTKNNPASRANLKSTFPNLNSTISKSSDKGSSNNMNKAMGENDRVSNNTSTPMNKTDDIITPITMGKPILNNISHNMNNKLGTFNHNDIHNKYITMNNHNPGIPKKVDTSKSSLNDKISNNNIVSTTNGATKIADVNHTEGKVSDQNKIVSGNTNQYFAIKNPYIKSNISNGTDKTTEFLKNKYSPHNTPNDHIQKRVQNIYSSPYDPSKSKNDKVNNFDFKKRNLGTNATFPLSSRGNDMNAVIFSATNGDTNPRDLAKEEIFQSLNLQRPEAARQESNQARDNNLNLKPNKNIRDDGQVAPITKNSSNQLHSTDKSDDSKFKEFVTKFDSKLPNSAGTNTLSSEKSKSPSTPTKSTTPAKSAKIHGITLTNSSLSSNVAGIPRFAERRNKLPVDYASVSSISKQPNEHERIKLRAESIKSNPFISDLSPLHGGEPLSKEVTKKEADDSTKENKPGSNKRKHNVSYSNVSSSSSDDSSSSESETNNSDVENKRPRLAAAVPSSISHPNVLHQSQSIFSPASKEEELSQTRKDYGSHPSATKASQESPQKTPETPSSYQDKSNIKKPILTSLSDLALRGVPDVESTSTVDLGIKEIKKSKDETSDGETTDDLGSSSSTDSDDSDSDQDTSGKFINIKKLNQGKPKRNKGGFSALMKDARKF